MIKVSQNDGLSGSTIADCLNKATSDLKKVGINSARLDSSILLEFTLKKSRSWILAHADDLLSEDSLKILNNYLNQRKSRTPLAYIIGSKEFYGRDFTVNEQVLIPRPESESIIDLVIESANNASNHFRSSIITIIDIGTGSGCLAITAKLEINEATVIATDISEEALSVARQNVQRYEVDVELKTSDLFSSIKDRSSDIIIANLPYVPDKLVTSEEITKEPVLALFSGHDGMDHYKEFWKQVSKLKDQPLLIITESLYSQHETMRSLALAQGYQLNKIKDLIQVFKNCS